MCAFTRQGGFTESCYQDALWEVYELLFLEVYPYQVSAALIFTPTLWKHNTKLLKYPFKHIVSVPSRSLATVT